MKTITNETQEILINFLESKKKVVINDVKLLFEQLVSESGGHIYNNNIIKDINELYKIVDRCENVDMCKYHNCILSIVMEAANILPTEDSILYDISNDNSYKFKILSKEISDVMSTRDIPFIKGFIIHSLSPGWLAENITECVMNETQENIDLLRNIDHVIKSIFKSNTMNKNIKIYIEGDLKSILTETSSLIEDYIDIKYKGKKASRKITKEERQTIYDIQKMYGMV